MMSFIALTLLTAASLVLTCSAETVLTWPSPLYDSLEHLLVDTSGANDAGFKAAITPCTNYVSGSQLLGRETAAQWIRVAFRAFYLVSCLKSSVYPFLKTFIADDFATADVEKGTGGIDASIGFETLRPENSGSAMNDSLAFFAPYVNAHTSSECPLVISTYDRLNTDYNDNDDLYSVRPHSSQCRDGSRCLQRSPNPTSRRAHRCYRGW